MGIAIGLLPQHVIVRVHVDIRIKALCCFRRELAVIVVAVGQDDALNLAIAHQLCHGIEVVGRVDDVDTGGIAKHVDVIVHVPFAAVQTELSGSYRAFNLH